MSIQRCSWAEGNPLLRKYHDVEWGVPVHNDQHLFEMLNLEGAQSGLSWLTILTRRDGYRRAFDDFDVRKIAKYGKSKKMALLQDEGIIRNRLKINACIENAKTTLVIQQTGSLDAYLWGYVGMRKLTYATHDEAVEISISMSKGAKKDGFHFLGPTTCYAFMQAVGMINDHTLECFRYRELLRG